MTSRFSTHAVPSAVLLACLALAGCGGGNTASTNIPTIAGTVIDGYIEGATVCLDTNANQACDAGEPSATTAKDGSYKLDTSTLTAEQIKAAHLLTVVPTTAKDADDAGKTLAEAGKKGFSLLAPAAAYVSADGTAVTGAVISPLTTLVSHDMIASGTVLDTAKSNVRARLNLDAATDLTQDFVAKKDTGLMQTAQMLTVAIGEVKAAAKTADTTATDRQALFAALDYLQKQVAALKTAYDAAKTENPTATPVTLLGEANKTEAAKPVVADLLAEAKKTTESSAVSSVVALIESGFYSASHVLETASTNYTAYYSKIMGAAGKITADNNYKLTDGKWVKDTDNSTSDWQLTSTGWKSSACATGESISYNAGSDGVTTVKNCNGTTFRVTARAVDASGQTLKALGLEPPTAFAETKMPAGSQLIWWSDVNPEDEFSLYTGYAISKYEWNNSTSTDNYVPYTSLDSFIAAHTQSTSGSTNSSYIFQWSGLYFSFAADGALTLFNGYSNSTKIGTATYTRRTVHGVEVLTLNTQAPYQDAGERIFFAVKDGKVYGGSYTPKGTANTLNPSFNKTMMNAILAAGSKPTVVD
jgi:outer membrane murein-binding lipoprotein Lpp